MLNRDTQAMRDTAVPGVEETEQVLRGSCQNMSNDRRTGHMGTDAQERVHLPTYVETRRYASFRVVADQITPGEILMNTENNLIVLWGSEQLVRDAVAGVFGTRRGSIAQDGTKDPYLNLKKCSQSCIGSLPDLGAPHRTEYRELTWIDASLFACRHW